jgi:hypothetical protein
MGFLPLLGIGFVVVLIVAAGYAGYKWYSTPTAPPNPDPNPGGGSGSGSGSGDNH